MSGLVLLTGATGFVGRAVLTALAEHGARMRLVVRAGTQSRVTDFHAVESVVSSPDLFGESHLWWQSTCAGVDTIVHAAWYAEPGEYKTSPRNLDCLGGTLALAKGAMAAGVRRFVGVGTCAEYDLSAGYLSVKTPLKPTSPYASAKAAAFLALSDYFANEHREFAWCRLFYLYGAGEDERRLIPYIRARLAAAEPAELTSGTQVRDFMDVEDAGRMIADVALGGRQGPVNVCSGTPITVRALAERIADEYGRRDLLRFGANQESATEPRCVVGIRGQDDS